MVVTIMGDAILEVGQPVLKTIQKPAAGQQYILNYYEAVNLNYYGGGIWSPMMYDAETDTLFCGVGNGNHAPYDDVRILSEAEETDALSILSNELSLDIARLLKNEMTLEEHVQHKSEYEERVLAQETARMNRLSARANRFMASSLVALSGSDGAYKFHLSSTAWDGFNWGQKAYPDVMKVSLEAQTVITLLVLILQLIQISRHRIIAELLQLTKQAW